MELVGDQVEMHDDVVELPSCAGQERVETVAGHPSG